MVDKTLKKQFGNPSSQEAKGAGVIECTPSCKISVWGSEKDKKYFKAITEKLVKSDTGKKLLEKTANKGYGICFEKMEPTMGGFFSPERNAIVINSSLCNDHNLPPFVGMLAHEMRHLEQAEANGYDNISNKTADSKTRLMADFCMEADANAIWAKTAYELKAKGESDVWQVTLRNPVLRPVLHAYAQAKKETKNDNDGMNAAFCAYLDNKEAIELYGNFYANKVKGLYTRKDILEDEKTFSHSESSASIVGKICVNDGKSYVKDASVLENPKNLWLSPENFKILEDYNQKRCEKTGLYDASIYDIAVHTPKKEPQIDNLKAAAEVLKQKRQR